VSHPFDATLKDILRESAADLAPVLHLPSLPARSLNIDLSTISAATDVAFGFGDPINEIDDINFQSGPDPQLDARLLLYNAAYRHRYAVTVRSIVILLRPAADHPLLTGRLAYQSGSSRVEFDYELIRLWQQPAQSFLTGGLGLLPLAPLCQLPADVPVEQALRELVHQIDRRLAAEAPYERAVKLMTAAFVLTGIRVARDRLTDVFRGVKIMHESSAFDLYEEKGRQEGRQEGRLEESHRMLLRQGRHRFGAPAPDAEEALRSVRDLDRLERLADAILTANTWQELLATP
jgi:predicted transposase YdaD